MNFLAKVGRGRTPKRQHREQSAKRRLHAERLEDRHLLATVVSLWENDQTASESGSDIGQSAVPPSPTHLDGTPNSATVPVVNDEEQPTISIVASDHIASEAGPSTGQVTISRQIATSEAIRVFLAMAGTARFSLGRAGSDDDFTLYGGLASSLHEITIGAGQTSATITITPIDDDDVEGLENVTFTVVPKPASHIGVSYEIGSLNVATVQIADNDLSLLVDEGGSAVITRDLLLYDDNGQSPADITYHVVAGLVHGQLELASAPGVAIVSFTQTEINAGEVLYVHDGSYTPSESFQFIIEDGLGNQTDIGTVKVLVQRASSWRNPVQPFNVYDDNSVDTLDLARFVLYLKQHWDDRTLPALPPGSDPTSFVDINGDNIVDTLDLAELVRYIKRNGTGALIDVAAPEVESNVVASVSPGSSVIFNVDMLHFSDLQPLEKIRYTITTPPAAGRIESVLSPNVLLTTFTQADLNARRIRYVHDGSATDVDSFDFRVDDGRGNLSSNQQFEIDILADLQL
jgi:hypothetical protein